MIRSRASLLLVFATAVAQAAAPPQILTGSLADGTVGAAYSQTLNASGGAPPYQWRLPPGALLPTGGSLPAGLVLSSAGVISGTPSAAGVWSFFVEVTDSANESATKPMYITVHPAPLSVNSSDLPNGTAGAPYAASLQAGGGTPPFTWSLAGGSLPPGLTLAPGGAISGTPTTHGTASFTVRVTDAASQGATRPLSILIAPPPVSVATTDLPAGTTGVAYSASLQAGGGTLPFTWALAGGSLPAGLTLAPGGAITGRPATHGTASFTVRVTDAASQSATRPLSISIASPPVSVATTDLPAGMTGVAYSASLQASGGTPPFTWALAGGSLPGGLTLAPGGAISGTPASHGTSSFTIRVTDAASQTATRSLAMTIAPPALAVTPAAMPAGTVGKAYFANLVATGGVPPYSWSISGGALPEGLSLNASGTLAGIPVTPGRFSVTVRVADAASMSATRAFDLIVEPPLAILTPALASASLGASFSQPLQAAGGSPPYLWSIAGGSLPPGITLGSGGVLSGMPNLAGDYPLTIQVTDSAGAVATRQYTISVAAGLLVTTPPVLQGGTVGVAYSETLQAGGGRAPYTWSITEGGLADGVRLDPATGALAGTPTATGTFVFTASVADASGARASRQFTLTIAAGLRITSAPLLPEGTVEAPYSAELRATGGRPPYRWSVASGTMPPGLGLNSESGTVAGAATASGSYRFTARVEDSASASATVDLTLVIAQALRINNAPTLPAASLSAEYEQELSAAGGSAPYVWTVAAGALPAGISLSSAGVLAGVPSAAGDFGFTVRVTDTRSAQTMKDFTLTVASGLLITTGPLPDATAGALYAVSFAAAGGTAPYSWAVQSGSLPPGVELNASTGELRGAPSAAGTFNFTLKVLDAAGQSFTRTFSIAVQLPSAPSLRLTGVPEQLPAAEQVFFELQVNQPYPVEITGVLTLDFEPDPAHKIDDPAVQFTTGGRSVEFRIPSGSTKAVFPAPQVGLQTGTVTGGMVLRAVITASGRNLAVSDNPLQTASVAPAVPGIRSVRLRRDAQGITVEVSAYSTPRELRSATLRFEAAPGASINSGDFTVSLADIATAWYGSAASGRFGSLFILRLPFTVQGASDAVGSVSVVLTNALGESQPMTSGP